MENCTSVNVNGEKNIFECVNRTFLFLYRISALLPPFSVKTLLMLLKIDSLKTEIENCSVNG